MTLFEITKLAFKDEFEKIAGSMNGLVRSGRRPIGALKLIKKSEMRKASDIVKLSAPQHIFTAGVLAGAGGLHMIRKANEDRKLGKQLRTQQQ
jgi:hypothetical protein